MTKIKLCDQTYNRDRKKWTQDEEKILMNVYHLYSTHELALMFNTNPASVNCCRRKLGIGMEQLKPPVPEGHKRCSSCQEIKPLDDFYVKCKNDPNGIRNSKCKACSAIEKSLAYRESRV